MGHPDVNRYRSGSKNPHQEVLVAKVDDGSMVTHVVDWAHGKIVTLRENPEVDQGKGITQGEEVKDG